MFIEETYQEGYNKGVQDEKARQEKEVIKIPIKVIGVLSGRIKVDCNIVLARYDSSEKYKTFDVSERVKNIGEVFDGYHTFNELYDMRLALTVALFKTLCKYEGVMQHEFGGISRGLWKSKLHPDSTMFEGFFIVGMSDQPKTKGIGVKASYITFHYPLSAWDLFDMCDELPKAPEWDGHTEKDVLERLKNL